MHERTTNLTYRIDLSERNYWFKVTPVDNQDIMSGM